jgi:alcohol dehydrogenase (cytochrome c)
MTFTRLVLSAALCGAVQLCAQAPAGGGRGQIPQAEPLFTSAQAAAGKSAYAQNCASCHGASIDDGEFAPPLRGAAFLGKYAGKPAADLFTYVSTKMPPGNPGSVGGAVYAQVIAYILQQNGLPTGNTEFASSAAALASIDIPGSPGRGGGGAGGGLSAGVKLPPAPKKANPLDKISPVTDAMLQNPATGEWLTWRRGFDYQGFSPLKQITKGNVKDLRVAWTWALSPGANEATPIVHDGVMFLHSPGDKVEALDAATGDLLWQYTRQLPAGTTAGVKRNISIYGNKVYMGTSDVHMVALDVKTGRVVWDEALTTEKGFNLTGGPLVAKGKVMVGTGGRVKGKNYIVALDAETGKFAWRFNTIAQPGEPGGDSWNGHPADERNGASVWIAGSYDSQLNLAFFGVAQTYDTEVLAHPVNKPGVTNDGLYTDCTLAINPDTGKLVWYYQHLPNDQWDLDWVFERQIVRMPVNGTVRPVIMTSGKQAIYDVLDAETGKWIYSKDLGLQNEVSSIDPVTGKKNINPDALPGDGKAHMVCPHAGGAKSWIPSSYNPDTKIMYIPLVESCMDLTPVEAGGRGSLSTGVRWTLRPRPDSDGKYGRVEAVNMLTREVVWTERHRAPVSSGTLATSGGVVFNGSIDRFFRAYDDQTGKLLWETRLSDVPSNAPISYTVNGKQYIAIGVGNGGAQAMTFPPLVPEIQNVDRAPGIWVFELP